MSSQFATDRPTYPMRVEVGVDHGEGGYRQHRRRVGESRDRNGPLVGFVRRIRHRGEADAHRAEGRPKGSISLSRFDPEQTDEERESWRSSWARTIRSYGQGREFRRAEARVAA